MAKLVNLQALRGVAASFVVVDHCIESLVLRGHLAERWLETAWLFGWLGVAVFFLISGFIIIQSVAEPDGKSRSPGDFLLRRLIRIVPLYWASTALYFGLKSAAGSSPAWGALVKSLLFIPYMAAGAPDMRPVVGQGWTLNYEMFFYCILALCLLFRRPVGAAVLFGAMLTLIALHPLTTATAAYDTPRTLAQFWTDPILAFFVLGAAIGHLKLDGGVRRSVLVRATLGRPFLVCLGLLALDIALFEASPFVFSLPYGAQALFGILPVAALLVCTVRGVEVENRRTALLSRIGDASYSTYLLHPLVILAAMPLYGRLPEPVRNPVAFIGVSLVVSTLVGQAVFTWFERPVTGGLRRISGRRALLRL